MKKKVAVFGANGFIGSSKSSENKHNFPEYISLDLTKEIMWSDRILNQIKECNRIIFCSAIAHKSKIDPYKENLKILNNFLTNYKKINENKELIYLSTSDVKYLEMKVFRKSSYFPLAYARSKIECEKLLHRKLEENYLIMRLPVVYSRENKFDLMKRCKFNIGKIEVFFKIIPPPIYEAINIDEINDHLFKVRNINSFKDHLYKFSSITISQDKLICNNKKLTIIIPKIFIIFLSWFFSKIPYSYINSRSLNLKKLLDYDYEF